MQEFIYTANPGRVIFGSGTRSQLVDEVCALGIQRALIITTPEQENLGKDLVNQLKTLTVGLFSRATMHTPVEITLEALQVVQDTQSDGLIAIGGGSTIGLTKAIALKTDLPQIILPTTYSGSEMTPIVGQTENHVKTTQRTNKVLPEVVIYDVDLTLSLPASLSITSGINAMAHAVEALYAENKNPIISHLSVEGISALYHALPNIYNDQYHPESRSHALYGAWLCGMALGSVGMALHHKLCHTLGGTFNLPHAQTHTVILPHVSAFNATAVPELDLLGQKLAGAPLGKAIWELAVKCGAPSSLQALGMPLDGLDKAAELAIKNPYFNPRPLNHQNILSLLERAYHGKKPE